MTEEETTLDRYCQEKLPQWYMDAIEEIILLAPAVQIGIKLGNARFSMKTYGVSIDIDVDGKRDVFRFETGIPMEDVEISAPWGSELSHQIKSLLDGLTVQSKREAGPYSRECPNCGEDTGIEARNYCALSVLQCITCPHCGQDLVSDYLNSGFLWAKFIPWTKMESD